jgi:hypothetical protein
VSQTTTCCPTCHTEVETQGFGCLETGKLFQKIRCPKCRKVWRSWLDFAKSIRREQELQNVPSQICRNCGRDTPPDELWDGLGQDAGICFHCRQCPGCGGVLFRRDATEVVCEACGSHWKDGLEFAQDFLPRAHIYR